MKKLFLRSLFAIVGLMCCNLATASQSLKMNNVTVKQAFVQLHKATGYSVVYDAVDIDTRRKVNVDADNVKDAIRQIVRGQDVDYEIIGKRVVVRKATKSEEAPSTRGAAQQQQQKKKNVTRGRVVDSKGEPLVGVSVKDVRSSATGTITDINGNFTIATDDANPTLEFSYIGFAAQRVTANGGTVQVRLAEENQLVDEIVVTALGMKRSEKALGYATQKVSGELFEKVKGTNVATSLTGRISGLTVYNSTEFNEAPTMTLRGETPLLVLDGVPTNLTLGDLNQDDIESINVLKGATASALYGSRGGSGVIMVTTKKGGEEGFHVTVNSSTMFNAGTLALPEVQHSYSSGYGGKYNVDDEVWGDKMDIGRVYSQYNPTTHQWEDMPLVSAGKDNLKNFRQFSLVTNNTVAVTQQGKNGSFHTSLNYIYNRGQYPNEDTHQWKFNTGGMAKLGKRVSIEGTMGFSNLVCSNTSGTGYGDQGYIYNMLVWTGAEYDVRDYKDYWAVPDEEQNWMRSSWYDNPYLMAWEKIVRPINYKANGMVTVNYQILSWLKAMLRAGFDYTSNETKRRAPIGIHSTRDWGDTSKGYYEEKTEHVFTTNDDFILSASHPFGDFNIDALAGVGIYYYRDKYIDAATKGGISVPGFYSIAASVESPTVTSYVANKRVNSLYGQASLSYKDTYYLDFTGRNDWSSTLPKGKHSYFYPSIGTSVLLSNIIKLPTWWNFWKIRGSWTVSKTDLGIYDTNQSYVVKNNVWNGMNTAAYPSSMYGSVKPITNRTYEIGTNMRFLQNRLNIDFTYYNKLTYNNTTQTAISSMSGFTKELINTDEEYVRRGYELMISGMPVRTKDFQWDITANWSLSHRYFSKIDPVYSEDKPYVAKGKRVDYAEERTFTYDPDGNLILTNGYPRVSNYYSKIGYYDPNWVWGITNTFKYKNFTLVISVDGRVGGRSYSTTNQKLWQTGAAKELDNEYRYDEVVNGNKNYIGKGVKVLSGEVTYDKYGNITSDTRVFGPNDVPVSYENYIKKYYVKDYSLFTLDETFIKLRELSLTYDLPTSLAHKLAMKGASVSLIGQNLLLWCKDYKNSDPDKASDDLNSPSIRYVGLNIKVDF